MAQHEHEVLVVEDDYAFRWAVAVKLQRQNVEVDVAENGAEAVPLLKLKGQKYCAMILDLRLPPPDGLELLGLIAEICPALPVLVVTAYDDMAEPLSRARYTSQVKKIVRKPVDVDELARMAIESCTLASA